MARETPLPSTKNAHTHTHTPVLLFVLFYISPGRSATLVIRTRWVDNSYSVYMALETPLSSTNYLYTRKHTRARAHTSVLLSMLFYISSDRSATLVIRTR